MVLYEKGMAAAEEAGLVLSVCHRNVRCELSLCQLLRHVREHNALIAY